MHPVDARRGDPGPDLRRSIGRRAGGRRHRVDGGYPVSLESDLQQLVLANWSFWSEGGQLRYRAPKDAATSAVLDGLRAHRSEIAGLLERTPEILDVCHLSHGQLALWFLWALAPCSSAYNQSLVLSPGSATTATPGTRRAGGSSPATRSCGPGSLGHRSGRFSRSVATSTSIGPRPIHPPEESLRSCAALAAEHAEPFDLETAPRSDSACSVAPPAPAATSCS